VNVLKNAMITDNQKLPFHFITVTSSPTLKFPDALVFFERLGKAQVSIQGRIEPK